MFIEPDIKIDNNSFRSEISDWQSISLLRSCQTNPASNYKYAALTGLSNYSSLS